MDEHSADVGAITRLEAFLDSLKNFRDGKVQEVRGSEGQQVDNGALLLVLETETSEEGGKS